MIEPSTRIPSDFAPSPTVEVYGNYHTAGIIVGLPEGLKAPQIGRMQAYLNVNGVWSQVQDPVEVRNYGWFATSLFWLKPESTYQVKVEVLGTASNTLATWYGQGATRKEPVIRETTDKLYVATDGNDSNPGTLAAPFKTLAHGVQVLKPGETLFVRGGTYYEGDLQFAAKANEAAPLIVRAYPGEKPVISGADPAALDPAAWKDEGSGVYSHPTTEGYRSGYLEDKRSGQIVRFFPIPSLAELRARKINDTENFKDNRFASFGIEAGIFTDGTRVYITTPGSLADYRVNIGLQGRGFQIAKRRSIQIDGLRMECFGANDFSCAIFVDDSDDVLIQNCQFHNSGCYITAKRTAHRLTIQDCLFKDDILNWPFGYMKSDGAVSGFFETGSINVDGTFSGRGLVFRRNKIRGLFDGAHLGPWTLDEARTQETDFYQNDIDGCMDDFIEVDGYARNVRVFDNYMVRSLSGISVAQALDGPTYMIYNVIGDCGMVPAAQREKNAGYPFKTNGGPEVEVGSGPMYFYHNTSFTLDPLSRAMLVKSAKWKSLTMRNNIWAGQDAGIDIWEENPSPIDMDYDTLYIGNTNVPLVVLQYHTIFKSIDTVRRRLKWLKHGLVADPLLQDPKSGDFTLRGDSPCIDAGTALAGINEGRALGKAPDMGAYESR
ncbi:MAG: DUF1565 domain-containing protein [Lentisphaerae bacterium]|nr:DUF1565 domain-containing protein [Lentisphaerota bacterium]